MGIWCQNDVILRHMPAGEDLSWKNNANIVYFDQTEWFLFEFRLNLHYPGCLIRVYSYGLTDRA